MINEKIETFLTQFKSLDALGLSLIEEFRTLQTQNKDLVLQNNTLQDQCNTLQAQLDEQPKAQAKPKIKKTAKPAKIVETTPSLF